MRPKYNANHQNTTKYIVNPLKNIKHKDQHFGMIFTFAPYASQTTSVLHLSQNKTYMFTGAIYRYTLITTYMEP